jgi:outer membrane protein TolC
MFRRGHSLINQSFCRRVPAALAVSLLFTIAAAAQDSAPAPANANGAAILKVPGDAPADTLRLSLTDAQQRAQVANAPLARLGELQVEAARQHRLGVKSMYFPAITTQFVNLHLSETPGELLTFQRPITGGTFTVPVETIFQDQTVFNATVTQPITQLFGVRQLVKIARADENIAKAKAGMPIAEATRQVEKNFFDLLVAERELQAAAADAKTVRTGWVRFGETGSLGSAARQADAVRAETSRALAAGKVTALTAALNELLGLAPDTRLELVPPPPPVENLTLKDALAQAQASPQVAVIEAEQTAVKAHAGARLAKLEYGPGIAIIGGYTHQRLLNSTVLPEDFGYVGVVATYTLFDSFKREHAVKETAAQAKAAELGAELARDKAAAAVKAAYFELERSRDAYYLARQMLSTTHAGVSFVSAGPDAESSRARAEADVFRAEIGYREAYAALTSLIAGR